MSDRRTEDIIRIVCPFEVEQALIVRTESRLNALLLFLIQEIDISSFKGMGRKCVCEVLRPYLRRSLMVLECGQPSRLYAEASGSLGGSGAMNS